MTVYEMRRALNEARIIQRDADDLASNMAKMVVGRLRHIDKWTLCELKRELRGFNMHTREWKS